MTVGRAEKPLRRVRWPARDLRPLPRRIVVLISGVQANGGIQRYNRALCTALGDIAAAQGAELEVLSLHDADAGQTRIGAHVASRGYGGARARFAAGAVAALARPHALAVIAHVDFLPLLAAVPRVLRTRDPYVVVTYGLEVWSRLPAIKRRYLHAAERVVAVSAYTAGRLVEQQGVPGARISVIPCALDAEFLGGLAAWRRDGNAPPRSRLLSIARLDRRDADKGIDTVISALPEVHAHVPDASYTVIGDGDDRHRLEQLARDRGVLDAVTFAGSVPGDRLHAMLDGTDVFVLPSRKEGFGIVFIEAMAHRKPVIAGNHGGSPEVVVNGETGLLVDHGNIRQLAAALIDLLGDAERRDVMGAAGERRALDLYTYHRFRAMVESLTDAVPARSSARHTRRVEQGGKA